MWNFACEVAQIMQKTEENCRLAEIKWWPDENSTNLIKL